MDDTGVLTQLNDRFIEAFRQGSWELLRPILSENFCYLDGSTGEVWELERYIDDLDGKPLPGIGVDQVAIHVDGDTAVVSARSFARPGRYSRYLDTYRCRDGQWECVHACVWPLQ